MGRPAPQIGDYALIGDCRSAALVSRDGSMDWLCWPRFDSPSYFGKLLDAQKGGCFAVRPVEPYTAERRYVRHTNVLETTFTTGTGSLRLTDFMPVATEEEKSRELYPDHQILRIVECLSGRVDVEVLYDPRPDYGLATPRLADRGPLGFFFERGGDLTVVRSEIPLRAADTAGLSGIASLAAGDRRRLSLAFAHRLPGILPPLGELAEERLHRSVRWWESWSSTCAYDGPYYDDVVRSALTLKLMAHAPSGSVIAAPTTSLPEQVGGGRNWDYRYCWLRDASLTLRVLFALGYLAEGEAFLAWLVHATRLTHPELQILYDVYGETHLPERELPHLAGYQDSRPVRVGNDAAHQLQLDTYGEVVDAAHRFVRYGGRLDRHTAAVLVGLGNTVCRRWREPDEGIWEIRSGRRHHTFSKAMCWVALDRLLKLHSGGHVQAPAARFVTARDAIRAEIEKRGYSPRLGSYVSTFDSEDLDASLLLLALYGYAAPEDHRIRATCTRIYEQLGDGPLLYRYRHTDDGLSGDEGAFGICSFWGVESRALMGDIQGATDAFEAICRHANDVGLFGEEIDPATGAALGNFPQAFTHVGLISAALTLRDRMQA
jgi:GH15 family glucan-1,4-alpha-glucosidase